MGNTIKNYFRQSSISLILGLALVGAVAACDKHSNSEKKFSASVIGVHHLGSDYLINRFYINKRIGDNVSEEGGGGSRRCCVRLPEKWTAKLTADVRWKVHHIIRPQNPGAQETEEVEGIYRAQVPVEQYAESGDLYIHFFSNGRVRLVVSSIASDGHQHPIQSDDLEATRAATAGSPIDAIFSKEDLADLQREIDRDRKLYGDWR